MGRNSLKSFLTYKRYHLLGWIILRRFYELYPRLLYKLYMLKEVSVEELKSRAEALHALLGGAEAVANAAAKHLDRLAACTETWPTNLEYLGTLMESEKTREQRIHPWQLMPKRRRRRSGNTIPFGSSIAFAPIKPVRPLTAIE